MVKKSKLAIRHEEVQKKKELKQASAALSIFGIVGFTAVVIVSQIAKVDIPFIVYGIFAGTILPPDILKRIFKVLGKD